MKKQGFFGELRRYKYLILMFLPALVWFVIFCYIPMGGIVMAFKEYDFQSGIFGSPWCGLENFEFLFKSGELPRLLKNTVFYNVLFMGAAIVSQLMVAIIFSEIGLPIYKKITQTLMCLPYFVSWVVVGAVAYNILNYDYGFINTILRSLGLEAFNFYVTPSIWKYILVFFNTWKGIGYGSVVYLAAVTNIDAEIYEAAQIDGASIWQRIWRITLPCLKPTIITMTLLSIGEIFRGNFQLFANLIGNNALLIEETQVIDSYVVGSLRSGGNFGMTSAAGLFQSALCFITIIIMNRVAKKANEDSALF